MYICSRIRATEPLTPQGIGGSRAPFTLKSKNMTSIISDTHITEQRHAPDTEIWKPVIGWECSHEVSNLGRVRSLDRTTVQGVKIKGKILSPFKQKTKSKKNGNPYLMLQLNCDGRAKTYPVHRLVAMAFVVNDSPNDKIEVNHIDEDCSNNRADNLEWCTHSDNINYGSRNQRQSQNNPLRREVDQYTTDGKFVAHYYSTTEAASVLNGDSANISAACRGIANSAYGYIWKYSNGKQARKVRRILPEEHKLIQLTLDGQFVAKYDSFADAVASVGTKPNSIYAALYRGCGICKGYRWMRNADYIARKDNQV